MAITALVTVSHTTPSDASFSAAGSGAWNGAAAHTITTNVTGYAAVADTGAYADLSGKPVLAAVATVGSYASLTSQPVFAAVAISGAYVDLSGTPVLAAVATSGSYASLTSTPTIPSAIFQRISVSGQSTVVAASVSAAFELVAGANVTVLATTSGNRITISAAAGGGITLADVYPIGSVYIETLGVNPGTTFGFGTWVSKGGGQVLVGFKTGSADFGTSGQTGGATGLAYTPSGTNSTSAFTPSGTNAITLFREAVSGTNAASSVTGTVSVSWPTGVPVFAGSTGSASVSVTWPTGKPVFTGATSTGHQHGLPIIHSVTAKLAFLSGVWGVGTVGVAEARLTATASATIANAYIFDGSSSGTIMLSQTAGATVASTGTVAWPASVPQANLTGFIPAGVLTWPATAPSAIETLTAAGQVFTGVTGSVSGAVFSGITGTVPAQVFSGIGATLDKLPPYITVFFWERTA